MKNKKKPNILILYSDQHSARALGCYGNEEVKTPNLDKLAREGVVMENAYCNNPICTPSRMCFLSGQYAHNFGYYGLMGKKPEKLPNLFKHFRKYGYFTGAVGKIHTPSLWVSEHCDFVGDGYNFEIPLQEANKHLEEGCQGIMGSEYDTYLASKGMAQNRDDKILHEWYDQFRHERGQCVDARPSRLGEEDSFEAWCAKKAIECIGKAQKAEKPFCLWLTLPRPHQTYCPAQKFWDMYDEDTFVFPPNANDDMISRDIASRHTQKSYQVDMDWIAFGNRDFESAKRRVLHGYYACVTQMDDAIGRVLDTLDALDITDDTIILYTTDHGEFAGEHGMIEKAPGIGYRCVTHVPLIWKYPGLEHGLRSQSLVESVDIFPTLCALAGVDVPDWVDGLDVRTTIEQDNELKDVAVTENPQTKTIHTKQYKFTQYLPEFHGGDDFGELYDIQQDPWELDNLYFKPEYQQVVQDLRYRLYCWLVRNTRIVTANPKIPMAKMFDVSGGISWDFADSARIAGEDGKIGKAFYDMLIETDNRNYL